MPQLLLELLSEEIPARMQAQAADDLKRLVCEGLQKMKLSFDGATASVTPRRLALVIDGLPETRPDITEERRGPRADAPQAAVDGFLRSVGLTLGEVEDRQTPGGRFLYAKVKRRGGATAEVLAEVIEAALAQLRWPRSMRWADHRVRWIRPLRSMICLFGGEVVAVTCGPVAAARSTKGHRFLAPNAFNVRDFADYRARLREAKVIVAQDERRERILGEARRLADAAGLTVKDDDALLDEVVGLVEWPVVLIGRIDHSFMDLPPEVLLTSMRAHQKYLALLDRDGQMAPRFLVVAGTETVDGGRRVIAGNERVLRARLSDARFFWDQDRRRTLESRVDKLAERVFHAKLGSERERVERIAALARVIARYTSANADHAERAGRLSKADLTTEMVGEFPELQGVMGRYYALHDGEPAAVADAIGEHYAPQGPGDRCPNAPVSTAVALADKIDTLFGFFAVGEKPTGSKDPFALRRAALGAIRLILENGLRVPLLTTFEAAAEGYNQTGSLQEPAANSGDLLDFFAERLKVYLRDRGVRHDLVSAVFAAGREDDLVRLLLRVEALRDFLLTDDGVNVLTALKRASNIVRIEEKRDGTTYDGEAKEALLVQAEEIGLHAELDRAEVRIGEHLAGERFADAMSVVAALRSPVDEFFDRVTVNCENAERRVNRLRLLARIRAALRQVADFSLIEG
jgi:glycyl-tRNA synthetase beta chain